MSKWLEQQLKYSSQLTLSKAGGYIIRTNNITLWNLLNQPEYQKEIQKDIIKKINLSFSFDFGNFLTEELVKEYKKTTGRDSEWFMSHSSTEMEGFWKAIVYLYPTPEEVNLKVKTKKWEWAREWEGMGVLTADCWRHIGCFSPKKWKPDVFIKVEKLNIGI